MGFKFVFSLIAVEVLTMAFMGQLVVKPLMAVVIEQNQMVSECEAKLSRNQFCEIVAIPKVNK